MKAHSNGVAADLTGASLQNLLPTPADGDQTTLAGALCPKAEPLCLGEKQSRQMILQCNPFKGCVIQTGIKSRLFSADVNTDLGRRCKWISLHMVNC